jgi:MFS family permease
LREVPFSVWRLTLAYALMMSGTSLNVLIAGIIGLEFAPDPGLATLPIALVIVGVAAATLPTGRLLDRWGRRAVFVSYGILAVLASLCACLSLIIWSFPLFCFSAFMIGWAAAAGHQYRFAALEKVRVDLAPKATSALLLGGILAAFIGPEMAVFGRNLVETPFAGSYLLLAGTYVGAIVLVSLNRNSLPVEDEQPGRGRALSEIVRSPIVMLAIGSAAVAYGVMSFLMTATPISMHEHSGHSLEATKRVIQAHIVAMYLPSLFYASLLARFGHRNMIFLGLLALLSSLVIAFAGTAVVNYWWSLVLLGIGWNFLFLGGTNMLAFGYHSNERFRVQSMNDFLVFSVQAVVALSSGWFLHYFQWKGLLYAVTPAIFAFAIMAWRSRAYELAEEEKRVRLNLRTQLIDG